MIDSDVADEIPCCEIFANPQEEHTFYVKFAESSTLVEVEVGVE